ncbi:MAG: amidohydrolase [Alphaproteobacteria bacterium]|nr:MAG: amidohydrolase [Alphaproteobacteria bacterium]
MNGLHDARTIDIHAHVVLEETMGAAGRFGPELTEDPTGQPLFRVGGYELRGVRYRGSPFMDVDLRLARMDESGIDFQVLSPNPLTYFHFIDTAEAVAFCRRHNDILAKLVAGHSNRLAGFAALPMQDPVAAIEELTRAVTELGLKGGYIGTDFGRPFNDPDLDPFYEACVRLDVPLFIHPAPAGIDGPAGDPNLKQFDLALLTGFMAQETLAVATLIFGGVLERHPKLDICVSHGGGAVAFIAGRLAAAGKLRPWSRDSLRQDGAFEEQLARIWYDNHLNDDRALDYLISIVGDDRLVLGTNFAGWDQHHVEPDHPLSRKMADNARRLLRADKA